MRSFVKKLRSPPRWALPSAEVLARKIAEVLAGFRLLVDALDQRQSLFLRRFIAGLEPNENVAGANSLRLLELVGILLEELADLRVGNRCNARRFRLHHLVDARFVEHVCAECLRRHPARRQRLAVLLVRRKLAPDLLHLLVDGLLVGRKFSRRDFVFEQFHVDQIVEGLPVDRVALLLRHTLPGGHFHLRDALLEVSLGDGFAVHPRENVGKSFGNGLLWISDRCFGGRRRFVLCGRKFAARARRNHDAGERHYRAPGRVEHPLIMDGKCAAGRRPRARYPG